MKNYILETLNNIHVYQTLYALYKWRLQNGFQTFLLLQKRRHIF